MYQTMCKKLSKTRVRACKLALVALLVALPGCSVMTKSVREQPPVELLADCPAVLEDVKTNGGLTRTITAYRRALAVCNIDKQSLREWAKVP